MKRNQIVRLQNKTGGRMYKIDLKKMQEVYGNEIIEMIEVNMDIISKNILIMKKYNFDDIQWLFEACPSFFMNFPKQFEEKLKKIIEKVGPNYVEYIQENVEILEE